VTAGRRIVHERSRRFVELSEVAERSLDSFGSLRDLPCTCVRGDPDPCVRCFQIAEHASDLAEQLVRAVRAKALRVNLATPGRILVDLLDRPPPVGVDPARRRK
jgi:hypothetical protein